MADAQIGSLDTDFVNKSRVQGDNTSDLNNASNFVSIFAVKAALNPGSSPPLNGYFTPQVMNQMTVNDLVYALRVVQEPQTI